MEVQMYFPIPTEEVHKHALNVYKPQIFATVQAETNSIRVWHSGILDNELMVLGIKYRHFNGKHTN